MTEPLVPVPIPAGGPAIIPDVPVPEVRRTRGGPVLSAILPGAPQLLAGRVGAGSAALLIWLSCAAVAVLRWDRVRAAPGGSLDDKVALLTLVAGLIGTWVWSYR